MHDSGSTDQAAEILASIDIADEAIPPWGHGWIHLVHGKFHLADGEHDLALARFRQAAAMKEVSPLAGRLADEEITKTCNCSTKN